MPTRREVIEAEIRGIRFGFSLTSDDIGEYLERIRDLENELSRLNSNKITLLIPKSREPLFWLED